MESSAKVLYQNGMVTISELTEDEAQKYREMSAGVQQEKDVIRWIADKDGERQILEQRADSFNRIRLRI